MYTYKTLYFVFSIEIDIFSIIHFQIFKYLRYRIIYIFVLYTMLKQLV